MSRWITSAGGAIALVAFGFCAAFGADLADPGDDETKASSDPGVAVVELFTSQGCSSCPSADRALAALHGRTSKEGKRVFVLSFHVDYWNNLGWHDPFSSAAFTERQREYAKSFRSTSVYTPQAIVNGTAEFVGSDTRRLDSEVDQALKKPVPASIVFSQEPWVSGSPLKLAGEVANARKGSVLCAAVCEDGLVSDVKKGENGGRRLAHDGVVRAFAVTKLTEDGKFSVALSTTAEVNPSKTSIVLYVQDSASRVVLGATAAPLKTGKPKPALETASPD